MSTDEEMKQYGKAAIYLRKPEKERMESQALPFDAKTAAYVADKAELYLKCKIIKKDGAKVTVELLGDKKEVKVYLKSSTTVRADVYSTFRAHFKSVRLCSNYNIVTLIN